MRAAHLVNSALSYSHPPLPSCMVALKNNSLLSSGILAATTGRGTKPELFQYITPEHSALFHLSDVLLGRLHLQGCLSLSCFGVCPGQINFTLGSCQNSGSSRKEIWRSRGKRHPYLMKNINLHIQPAKQTQSRIKAKRSEPRRIITLLKAWDRGRILRAARDNQVLTHKRLSTRFTTDDVSAETT